MIFNSLAKTKFSLEHVSIELIIIAYISLSLLLTIYIDKHIVKNDTSLIGSTVLSVIFQNCAFLPIPLAFSLYRNIVPVIVYAYTMILIHYVIADVLSSMLFFHG